MTKPVGSEIYRKRILGSDNTLQDEVWSPTPWIIDVYTGSISSSRYNKIISWCHEVFGGESDPIRGTVGSWRCGSVTVCGRTWLGFATKEQADQFESHWSNIRHPD